ncbi:MAG: hypothetical protein BKP49_08920 [Treponema sp. CETP13]|nr:MAG: hypothetical protein BKP49_08920 [Treponema sp. CETP13]
MQKNNKALYYAKNITDIFYNLKTVPHLQIFAGCTQCGRTADGKKCNLPDSSLIVRAIPELKKITKTEYLLILGGAVTLNSILALGKKHVPETLYSAIEQTATSSIRNIATIGGNICSRNCRTSLYSVLIALDAELEFKSARETKTILFPLFKGVPDGFILTEIRIPLGDWNVGIYKRLGAKALLNEESASFCFLADTTRNILTDFHVVYSGKTFLRSRELENSLIGSHLPLTQHSIDSIILDYIHLFEELFPVNDKQSNQIVAFRKWQFTNLLHYSFDNLI